MWDYEFIRVVERDPSKSRKTRTFAVLNKRSGGVLGRIKWHGPWRQYVFVPQMIDQTIYSAGCLTDIADFIVAANVRQRAGLLEPTA